MNGVDLYANMCSTELWNRERTASYVRAGVGPSGMKLRCEGCPGVVELAACVEDRPPEPDGYRLPELDPAPWYDPAAPESRNFAGLLVLEAKLSPALDRRMVQNVGHGGTLTRSRFRGRTLDVRGALIGKTCCAVEYGLRWLTQALLGSFCGGCDACDITFITCCPAEAEDDCLVLYEDGRPVPYFRAPTQGEWDRGPDFARWMCGAGLLSGPEVIACHGTSCGCSCAGVTEVEFTIGVGSPWLYRLETTLVDALPLGPCVDEGDCDVVFVKSDGCGVCPEPSDCGEDPDCEQGEKPPAGRLPLKDCGCLPLSSESVCFNVPADREWFEQVLILELSAGSAPLRNVMVSAFQNPVGYDCCSEESGRYFDPCSACATLFVDYVPAHGVLTFDSACRRVTVTCENVTRSAAGNLSTTDGLPFRWIELGCQDACVRIDVDCDNVADDATVTVKVAGREL